MSTCATQLIDVDAMVQHANIVNQACVERRDFTLVEFSHEGTSQGARLLYRSRMLYSVDVDCTFDARGGFWARHIPSGILEYAYPSSEHATRAAKLANPIGIARDMVQPVWNRFDYYSTRAWFAGSMADRLVKFNAAKNRES